MIPARGTLLRNGALVGIGLLSAGAIYLTLTEQMSWWAGLLIVVAALGLAGAALFFNQQSVILELLEESQQTEAEIQRRLVDALSGVESVDFATLAEQLTLPVSHVAAALDNLMALGLFSGVVVRDAERVYPRSVGYLGGLVACAHCGMTLPDKQPHQAVCAACGAYHADIVQGRTGPLI